MRGKSNQVTVLLDNPKTLCCASHYASSAAQNTHADVVHLTDNVDGRRGEGPIALHQVPTP